LADGVDDDHAIPLVTAYDSVTSVAGGGAHLCVVSATGALACSGFNRRGQLGNGSSTSQGVPPAPIAGLAGVGAITTGDEHGCAVVGGGIECWGANDSGQLGDGSTQDRLRPVRVEGPDRAVTALAAGVAHTCALLADRTAMCWGLNQFGQLGNGKR